MSNFEKELEETCSVMRVVISAMLDYPETLSVSPLSSHSGVVLRVACAPSDLGKLVGKQGRTARALRTILMAISKHNSFHLDLVQSSANPNRDDAASDVGRSVACLA